MTEHSEIAVTTAVPASNSGMPAAISAPKTPTSKMSVIGRDVDSALRKSRLIWLLITRSSLAPPASAIRRPGCAAWTPATAWRAGRTAWSSLFPGTLKATRTDLPSAEISDPVVSGDRTSVAVDRGSLRSAVTTCSGACRSSGSVRKEAALRAWISTSSTGGGPLSFSFSRTRSATPDCPGSFEGTFLVPISCPATKTIATKASQPNTVVLRCRVLHPATRSVSGRTLEIFRWRRVACWCGRESGNPESGNTELGDWRMVTSPKASCSLSRGGPRPGAGTRGRGRYQSGGRPGRSAPTSGPSGPGCVSTCRAGASGSDGWRSTALDTWPCSRAAATRT